MDQGKARDSRDSKGPATPPPSRDVYYKIGDVCARTDTQPYVLRFWESEFPQLAPKKSRSGQRIYTDADVELVQKIKKLLYEEEYTIAGARKKLEEEGYQAAPGSQGPKTGDSRRKGAGRGSAARGSSASDAVRKELLDLKKLLES